VLLPDKHIPIAASVLGLSGLIVSVLQQPMTFDSLMEVLEPRFDTQEWPAFHTAESVSLALSFLYAIELVDVTADGELMRCA
jgi:hypothetical protein